MPDFQEISDQEKVQLLAALTDKINPLMALHQKLTKALIEAGVIQAPNAPQQETPNAQT